MDSLVRELCARLCSLLPSMDAPVIVALSGGADSLALLHLLRFALRVPVEAAHFDHRMRPDSARDALWLRGLCRAWEVPLTVARSARPLRSETEARAARYAFFATLARRRPECRIATAHHADDQAETILLHLLRGTGLHGLAGIPATRGPFVRPLLGVRRAALESYAREHALRPRPDPTNRELTRPRAALRHLVLPRLERSRSGAIDAVLRLGNAAAQADERLTPLLREAAASVVQERSEAGILLARPRLLAYHPKFGAMLLRWLLRGIGCRPGRAGTAAAMQFITEGRSGSGIDLPGGVRIERSFDRIALRRANPADADDVPVSIGAPRGGGGRGRIAGRDVVVTWRLVEPAAGGVTEAFDPSALRFPLRLRGWRPGDRIRLSYGTKKLKKLFGERRLDHAARSAVRVLVDDRDRVLWVVGLARSADAAPAAAPALYITVVDG